MNKTPVVLLAMALLATGVGATSLAIAEDQADEINYLDLAARLLADDHLDRAQAALRNVDAKAEDLDRHRYALLSGLIALRQQRNEEAIPFFQQAISLRPKDEAEAERDKPYRPDPRLYLYLAQAQFALKRYEQVLSTLAKAGNGLADEESAYLMQAQSQYELKRIAPALATLKTASKRFPKTAQFERMQVFYLIELGLFQEATSVGERYLKRADTTAADYLAVGEALRRGKQFERACVVLEAAHLRFPTDDKIMLALAHAHLDMEHQLSAAMILEDAARLDASYAVQSAEMYRQAKRIGRALSLNSQVEDQKAKFKQRLALLLDQQDFELVAAMAPTIERLGLAQDDQIRYAMAFGFYKIGDRRQAEAYLRGIADAKLFESANGLRKAMQSCAPDAWECL